MRPPRAPLVAISRTLALCLLCGCSLNNLGDSPPKADIYMPTGLALSAHGARDANDAARLLYVVNSNFDLRYNSGSLQAYSLDAIDAAIDACGDARGSSCEIDPLDVLVDEVYVPSLETALAFSPDHSRMYVTARTGATLTFVDLDESADSDVLHCGDADPSCGADHQVDNSPMGARGLQLPEEPVGIATTPVVSVTGGQAGADDTRSYVLIAHRAGEASLLYDPGSGGRPSLIDVLSGLPLEPTEIAFDPKSRLSLVTVYARATTAALGKLLARVGIAPTDDPAAAFLYDAGSLNIDGVSAQRDTRAVEPNPARAGEALVLSRDPAALLFVEVATPDGTPVSTSAFTRDIVPVGVGPQRLALGELDGRPVAAVSCFDAREVYLVDAQSARVMAIVHNLDGPFELAIDSQRKRLYVADFRASVVRVLDLSPLVEGAFDLETDVSIIATLGIPKVVQELQ